MPLSVRCLRSYGSSGITLGSATSWWNFLNYFFQIGFLYLRYVADPKTLWNWFEPYVKDEEVCDTDAYMSLIIIIILILWIVA